MPALNDRLHQLTQDFIRDLLTSALTAPLAHLAGAEPRAGRDEAALDEALRRVKTRRARRRPTLDVGMVIGRILGCLRSHPEGRRLEQLRADLSLEEADLITALEVALGSGQVDMRDSVYFLQRRRGGRATGV